MPQAPSKYIATVIVTSDTCYEDPNKDTSGAHVVSELERSGLFIKVNKTIINDDKESIIKKVDEALTNADSSLIITVGGTGLCPRDVTPEATSVFYEKNCTGISTALHVASLRYSPHAALSRLTAGVSGNCLIINFPGSLKACKDCLGCLFGFIGHALEQVRFNFEAIKRTHHVIQNESIQTGTCKLRPKYAVTRVKKEKATNHDSSFDLSNRSISILDAVLGNQPHEPTSTVKTPDQVMNKRSDNGSSSDSNSSSPNSRSQPSIDNCVLNSISNMSKTKTLLTNSVYPLIEYSNALEIMKTLTYCLLSDKRDVVLNSLDEANKIIGDVLSERIYSKRIIPDSTVSTMDGYVINIPSSMKNMVSSIKCIQATLVSGLQEFEKQVQMDAKSTKFYCYQVNTGGRLPTRDFAVVPAEKAGKVSSNGLVPIYSVKQNLYIRRAGSDICKDDFIEKGTVIGPVELSLIVSMGHKNLTVFKRPNLGVISTGDELIDFFSSNENVLGSVTDTNGPLLTSLLRSKGYMVMNFGICKDEPGDIFIKLKGALRKCDILIITGGASMGSKDHVKDVIESMDGIVHFGRVNIKPGKPASFCSLLVGNKRKFIFSLPGNPVSAYITSIVLVMPFIEHGTRNHFMTDLPLSVDIIGDSITVILDEIVDCGEKDSYVFDGRLEFVRAKICPTKKREPGSPFHVTVSFKQQSSRMLNLKDCDCLIMIDPCLKGSKFHEGQTYPALRLRN